MGVRSPAPTLQATFMAPPERPPLERTDRPKQRSEGHVLWGCKLEPTEEGAKIYVRFQKKRSSFPKIVLRDVWMVLTGCVARTELVGIRTGLAAGSELVDTPNLARPSGHVTTGL